MLIVLHLAQVW